MLHPRYLFEAAGVWYAADIEKARIVTLTQAHWRVSTMKVLLTDSLQQVSQFTV